MSRLFVSLFVMIVVAVSGYALSLGGIIPHLVGSTVEDMRDYQLGGIIRQLDDQMEGLTPEQRSARLSELQSIFEYEVDLLELDKVTVSASEKQRLRDGGFVFIKKMMAKSIIIVLLLIT